MKKIILLLLFLISCYAGDTVDSNIFLKEKPDTTSLPFQALILKDEYIAKLIDLNYKTGEIKYKIFQKQNLSDPVGFYSYIHEGIKNFATLSKDTINTKITSFSNDGDDASKTEVKEVKKEDNELDLGQFLLAVLMIDSDKISIEESTLNNKIVLQSAYKRAFQENIFNEKALIFYIKFFVKSDSLLLQLNFFILALFLPFVVGGTIIKKGIATIDKKDDDSLIERALVAFLLFFTFYLTSTQVNQVARTQFQSFYTSLAADSLKYASDLTSIFSSTYTSYQARNSGKLDKEQLEKIVTNQLQNKITIPAYQDIFNMCLNIYKIEDLPKDEQGYIFPSALSINHLGTTWSERTTQKDPSIIPLSSIEFCHNIEAQIKTLTAKETENTKIISDYQEAKGDKLNEQQLALLQKLQMQNSHDYGFLSAPIIAANNMFSENLNMFQRSTKSKNDVETAISQKNTNLGMEKGVIADSVLADAIGLLPYMLLPGADSIKRTISDTLGTVSSKFESLPFVGTFVTAAKQGLGIGIAIFLLKYLILYLPIIALILASFAVTIYYLFSVVIYLNVSPYIAVWAFSKGQADALKSFFIRGVVIGLRPLILVVSIALCAVGLDLMRALNTLLIDEQFDNFFNITMVQNQLSTAYMFSDYGLIFIKGFIAIAISLLGVVVAFYTVFNSTEMILKILGVEDKSSGDAQTAIGSQVDQKSSRISRPMA
ncbi:MAG: hypothetical protein J0647_01525 [Campylobacteraceae bacterium]|nr:hypothetical protein [Campylobacteraceae bacterium]